MKACTVCKEKLSSKEFNKNSRTKDGRGSQCKRCDVKQSIRRQQEKKRKLVKLFGDKCVRCGYNKCPAALEFHHTSKDKKSGVTELMRSSFNQAAKEAKKCELLCANCHREEHYTDYGPLLGRRRKTVGCGTLAGYRRCGPPKCNACKKAKRQYMRRYRKSGGRGGN